MCDFHSTAWRLVGQDVQMCHLPSNSHSEMIDAAKWRVNEPNKRAVVFEAEWDCQGEIPAVAKLLKHNASECPPQVERAVVKYYKALQECILNGDHWKDFSEFVKFSDVWARMRVLPQGVVFPKECGYLDLGGLTSLPQGVVFPKECGYLYLGGLTSLPQGVVFPEKISGYLDLRGDLKAKLQPVEEKSK